MSPVDLPVSAQPDSAELASRLALISRAIEVAESRFAGVEVPGYVLISEIARGGQATVYRACRAEGGESEPRFAVKVLRPPSDPDEAPEQLTRLEREAEVLRKLHHPRILRPHEVGTTTAGQPYLVMDYVDGHALSPDLAARLPLDHRVALLSAVARTLAAAHAQGVIHRDLKPSNILIARDGGPVLLDFGMAAVLTADQLRQTLTNTGQFVGTYLWAAPEQLAGASRLTPAADVYALGVLLHQLATGGRFPPQVFSSLRGLLENDDLAAQPPSKRAASSTMLVADPGLVRILARCLAVDPAERYPTAAELADELDQYLASPQEARASRRTLTRRWLLAGAMSALVAAVGIPAYLRTRGSGIGYAPNRRINGRLVRYVALQGATAEMVYIPPGTGVIGSPVTEVARRSDERRQSVTFDRGYYLSTSEVSQRLYVAVMGVNPARFVDPENPVERVSWFDATEFCQRLAERTQLPYRLPTEVEWEYACRAGAQTAYHFGNDASLLIRHGNGADLSNTVDDMPTRSNYNDNFPRTARPGNFVGNAWHLYDMHGNVWEWTASPYQIDPLGPPVDVASIDPADLRYATRGGSWWDTDNAHRSANRNPLPPRTKTSTLGFRIALDDVYDT